VLQFHKNLVWIQSSTKVVLRNSAIEEDEELPHPQNPNNILQTLRQARKIPRRVSVFFFDSSESSLWSCLNYMLASCGLFRRREPPREKPNEIPQTVRQARKTLLACVLSYSFRVLSMVVHQLRASLLWPFPTTVEGFTLRPKTRKTLFKH
jgi:hypothetical protein